MTLGTVWPNVRISVERKQGATATAAPYGTASERLALGDETRLARYTLLAQASKEELVQGSLSWWRLTRRA